MTLAIVGVRVWDGSSDRLSDPCTIRVEGSRIAAIGPVGDGSTLLEGAEVVEPGPGCVALPGLIDGHVHLTLDPQERDAAAQVARSPEDTAKAAAERAAAMVRAGITTARDLGGGPGHLELTLRDRIASGEVAGPRLLCAGQPLTSPGGHCHFWGGEVEGDDEIRAFVAKQRDAGVDWIKIMATGGVLTKGTRPGEPQFEQARIETACDAARLAGRRIAAHCHATEGIRRAVRAGVDSVEHCSWSGAKGFGSDVDEALASEIGERGTWISPTVNAGWKRFIEDKEGVETEFFSNMRRAFEALRGAGARLIVSTDAGIPNVAHDALPRALPIFARFTGLSPVEVLRCATSAAAAALGVDDRTGRLEPGLEADVLVVQGDPLTNLSALERPVLVLARGVRA
ncbi:MAG: amidohydrolase family protein [Deltaproteobacteria bacterium]|nr:amidohydrolase family protein [Deltaproteobacteria bacterium]